MPEHPSAPDNPVPAAGFSHAAAKATPPVAPRRALRPRRGCPCLLGGSVHTPRCPCLSAARGRAGGTRRQRRRQRGLISGHPLGRFTRAGQRRLAPFLRLLVRGLAPEGYAQGTPDPRGRRACGCGAAARSAATRTAVRTQGELWSSAELKGLAMAMAATRTTRRRLAATAWGRRDGRLRLHASAAA